jgi:VanZ family protein
VAPTCGKKPAAFCGAILKLKAMFLIVIVLIVYGSLYPWHFHPSFIPGNPLAILLRSWPSQFDRFILRDLLVNLAIYMPVGMAGVLVFGERLPRGTAIGLAVLFGLVLSSSMEMIQLFDDGRDCSALDVLSNTIGTGIGVVFGLLYERSLKQVLDRAERSGLLHPSGALFLCCTWLGYEVFPLFPSLSRTALREKLEGLFRTATILPVEMLTSFVEWLVVARLLQSVVGVRRSQKLLPFLLLFIPGRLILLGRTFSGSELAGALLAVVCWTFLASVAERHTGLIAILLVSVIVLRGMAPYHWSANANPFSWVPFSGFLEADHDFGVLSFLRKCFWYGSSIWLLRASGWRLAAAAAMVAVVLAAIEVVQIHLPGRVAEMTDPVLALILAGILALADGRNIGTPQPSIISGSKHTGD